MSHAPIKFTAALCGALAMLASCSGNAEKQKAEALFEMAGQAMTDGDYVRATQLIDSIDSVYPGQIETRHKAMHLRPRVTELSSLREMEQIDSIIARLTLAGDSLQSLIVKVDNPIEPYYVAAESKGKSTVGKTGIEARMMPDGTLYLISSLAPVSVGHTSVTVSAGSESAQTAAIAPDGERNDNSLGYEVIHFMPGECGAVVDFIASHRNEPLTVVFNGRSSKSITLSEQQASAIATIRDAAENVRQRRVTAIERSRLEKQIELARRHQVETYRE